MSMHHPISHARTRITGDFRSKVYRAAGKWRLGPPGSKAALSRQFMGGELSKREGVLFHWWPFSSKRNNRL